MLRPRRRKIAALLFLALMAIPAAGLLAADDIWTDFVSKTGRYSARMPAERSTKTTLFVIGNTKALNSEETASVLDQRPYKNAMKTYIVKFDQTFGPNLRDVDVEQLLHHKFQSYIDYYEGLGGKVLARNADGFGTFWGGELYLSYNESGLGQQFFKARIFYNETTQLEQIIIGPEDSMNTFKTRDFIDSLQINDGIPLIEGGFREHWVPMTSPSGLFRVLHPPEPQPPYYNQKPVVKKSAAAELVGFTYSDPIRNESVFYNIYGYTFETPLNYQSAEEVLNKRHIQKHRKNTYGIKLTRGIDHKTQHQYVESSYGVDSNRFPFIQIAKLKGTFVGNTMVVQEILTSNALFKVSFVKDLMNLVEFPVAPEADKAAEEPAPGAAPQTGAVAQPPQPAIPSGAIPFVPAAPSEIPVAKPAKPGKPATP